MPRLTRKKNVKMRRSRKRVLSGGSAQGSGQNNGYMEVDATGESLSLKEPMEVGPVESDYMVIFPDADGLFDAVNQGNIDKVNRLN